MNVRLYSIESWLQPLILSLRQPTTAGCIQWLLWLVIHLLEASGRLAASFLTTVGRTHPQKVLILPTSISMHCLEWWGLQPYFSWAGTRPSLWVVLLHFCQGCVPCVRGPGLERKDVVLNSITGNDNLVFNQTKTQLIVGTYKSSLILCKCNLRFGGDQVSIWLLFACEGSPT